MTNTAIDLAAIEAAREDIKARYLKPAGERPASSARRPFPTRRRGVRPEAYAGDGRAADARRTPPRYRRFVARTTLADRFRALDPRAFDALLTIGLTVIGVGSQFVTTGTHV